MLSYSVSFNNKKLCRAETFSGNLTNLPKHALAKIKLNTTAPKNKFSIKDFFSKCDQIRIRKKNIIVALCIFELALNKKGVSGITNKK